MIRRRSNQKTFFDEIVGYYLPGNHFLEVNDIIDWTPVEKRLENLYDPSKGRPGYPPLIMFKALLLQQWFNLFDRDLSEAIADNLPFKSFLRLSLSDPVLSDTPFAVSGRNFRKRTSLRSCFRYLTVNLKTLAFW